MAGSTQDNNWPLPKFYFSVTGLNGKTDPVPFQEVTGLSSETTPIEYRHGDSKSFYPIKMPGLGKVGNVTMRKGIFAKDTNLFTWFDAIKLNTIERSTIVINLLDETGQPAMTWTLNNAFPIKITGTDLKSQGNEVAVESIDIAFETLTVKAASCWILPLLFRLFIFQSPSQVLAKLPSKSLPLMPVFLKFQDWKRRLIQKTCERVGKTSLCIAYPPVRSIKTWFLNAV